MTHEEVGTFIKLFLVGDWYVLAKPEDGPSIDAELTKYLDNGEGHDTLLYLTLMDGSPFAIRVSQITGWVVSNVKTRTTSKQINDAMETFVNTEF